MSVDAETRNGSAAATAGASALSSWRDGAAVEAILEFVATTCGHDGSEPVPVEERVAVVDNDGKLWCEKPLPIQMDFILRRFVEMAEANPALCQRQPWKAATESDHVRPVTQQLYGIPRERVIGSATALAYTSDERGGTITRTPAPDYLDDGPEKPVRIWSRTGRRPLFAAGNSNGDVPMLAFTGRDETPSRRILVRHDDDEREFAYTAGAEEALAQADRDGWMVVNVTDDWARVF